MLKNKAVSLRVLRGVIFLVLSMVSGLASCKDQDASAGISPTITTTVSAFATPALLASGGGNAVITWSSTNSTSCSSSPGGVIGTSGSFPVSVTTTATYTISCVGSTGSASQGVTITVVSSTPVLGLIKGAAKACAATPMSATNVYYYCDCGTGKAAGCVAGDDANAGTSSSAPRQTIAKAIAQLNSLSGNNTIAFCQGGAFNATGQLAIDNKSCPAGTTCNDIREYTPTTFTSNAKPIINVAAGASGIFALNGNVGGVRFLNLKLNGSTGASGDTGFFFYNGAHDVTMCNLDMNSFGTAVYDESGGTAATRNIKLTGSNITNSSGMGFLGSSNNLDISFNYWDGNGSSNVFDHTIYIGSAHELSGINVSSNYIHGQYGKTCLGTALVAHAAIDGLTVSNNTIVLDANQTSPGCWGIGFNNTTGNPHPVNYRHAVFSGNTIINGGNNSISISSCPGCVIENNLIIQDWVSGGATGITVSDGANRERDDVNNDNTIRNNTFWFSSRTTGTNYGMRIGTEGVGYTVVNNTVSSAQKTGSLSCYIYNLPPASYSFVNNNHCHSTVPNN